MKQSVLHYLLLLASASCLSGTPLRFPDEGKPILVGHDLSASGGEIVAYFLGSQQSTGGRLWLNDEGPALPNKTTKGSQEAHPGDSFSFGVFEEGTPIIVGLEIDDQKKWGNKTKFTPDDFFSSIPDDQDGIVYAYIAPWVDEKVHGRRLSGPALYVGFEAMRGGGRSFDYDDFAYVITGLTQGGGLDSVSLAPAGVPEPGTVFLAGAGLLALRFALRNSSPKND